MAFIIIKLSPATTQAKQGCFTPFLAALAGSRRVG
jgi:hypothetical protein